MHDAFHNSLWTVINRELLHNPLAKLGANEEFFMIYEIQQFPYINNGLSKPPLGQRHGQIITFHSIINVIATDVFTFCIAWSSAAMVLNM